jgi:NAD(P)-dependent dehydrogenase (short-subunit alcohol dehydrogenase family)
MLLTEKTILALMAIMSNNAHEHETDWFKTIYVGAQKIPLTCAKTPEDCAGAYVFLLSPLNRYVTGPAITVDGGLTATY